MKYIKQFESLKYYEGEYILLEDEIIAKINKISNFIDNKFYQYYIEILDKETGNFFNRHWINKDEIERRLNKKEKEFVKMVTSKNKFNI